MVQVEEGLQVGLRVLVKKGFVLVEEGLLGLFEVKVENIEVVGRGGQLDFLRDVERESSLKITWLVLLLGISPAGIVRSWPLGLKIIRLID